MARGSFEGPRERTRRALEHRETIANLWNGFVEDDSYSPFVRVNDDGTGSVGIILERMPPEIGFLLGEFLYQLRAALDGCIYDAAILESGQNPPPNEKDLEFPICVGESQFNNASWKLGPLSNERRAFVASMQPYNVDNVAEFLQPLNRSLGILNDWARKDRHRRLHVVTNWASEANPVLDLPDGVQVKSLFVRNDGFLDDQGEVATFSLTGWTPGMEINANPNVVLDIAVDEIPEPSGAFDTMRDRTKWMYLTTITIVDAMAKSFGLTVPK